jgi:anti-sigma-K factor RskA
MADNEHDDRREQAALFVLGALAPDERREFEAHLAGCGECAAEVRSLGPVPEMLAQTVPQLDPSPALRQRVLRSIAGASDTHAGSVTAPRSAFRLAPWLATAALLALTIALGAYTARLRTRVGDLESRLSDALARADAGTRLVAEARKAAADAEFRVAVLAAPDLARIDLAGQPVAPQAMGRGYWSRTRGLVFTASNLPALPAGRTYQLWVLTARTAPISHGWLIRPDPAGRAAATFETPLDLPQPTAMAVTIEPDGGVAAPTGDKYLVGTTGG